MTYSEDTYEWAERFVKNLPELVEVSIIKGPAYSNRMAMVSLVGSTHFCELSVWDSGDAEYYLGPRSDINTEYRSLENHNDLRQLFQEFESFALGKLN